MNMLVKPEPIQIECGIAGYFTFEAFKADNNGNEIPGTRRKVAEFKNLITNTGLNAMLDRSSGKQYYGYNCAIGSGNTPPTVTDSALQSFLVYVGSGSSGNSGKPTALQSRGYAADGTYSYYRYCFRFADGLAAYNNIQEVGIFAQGTGGSPVRPNVLCSRALILDGNGNPTSIAIQSDETLDIYYEIRFYPPSTDVVGSITLNGVNYPYNIRPIDFLLSQWSAWDTGIADTAGLYGLDTSLPGQNRWSNSYYSYGILASENQTLYPKEQSAYSIWGNTSNPESWTLKAYVANSFTRTGTMLFNLTNGNFTNGIGSVFFSCGLGGYKLTFTGARVPKTNQLKWTQDFVFTVARR